MTPQHLLVIFEAVLLSEGLLPQSLPALSSPSFSPRGSQVGSRVADRVYLRWTPHPVIVTIRDNKDSIKVLLQSYYTTVTGWGVLLRYIIETGCCQTEVLFFDNLDCSRRHYFECERSTVWTTRWTLRPVIVAIRDNKEYTRVLIYSYYTTITRVGVLRINRV